MDDLIKLLKPYPQPLSQPVPNRIWLHDLGGGDITWCDDPQPVPGEDMDNVAYIRVDIMNDRIEAQAAEIARLTDHLKDAQEIIQRQISWKTEAQNENERLREALEAYTEYCNICHGRGTIIEADEERAAIVAWLRERQAAMPCQSDSAVEQLGITADHIEAGEHLK